MKNIISLLLANKTFVNGSLFSLFSFINQGFSFLLLLVLAKFIMPAEYGYLSLFSTVVMVVNYFISMSIEGYLSVAYFKNGKEGVRDSISCVCATSLIVTIVLLVILFCLGDEISIMLSLTKGILFLSVLISLFSLYVNMYLDYSRIQEKVIRYGWFSCGNALLNFALSIFLVKYQCLGWEGRVYAQAICSVLFSTICILLFLKLGLFKKPNISYWKTMLIWGIPLIPHSASNFFRQGCDRYIINAYYDISEVGLFSFALTLSNIIIMIGMGFNQVNSVNIYKTLGDKNIDNQEKYFRLRKQKRQILCINTLSAVVVAILGYIITPIVLPKYSGGMGYFLILTLYGYAYCLYFLNTNFLFYYGKTRNIMYTTFFSSILHLILSMFLSGYSLYITALLYVFTQSIVVYVIRRMAIKEIRMNLNLSI